MTRHIRPASILAALAIVAYALLWVGFRWHWGWLDSFDTTILTPLHDYGVRHPGWVRFWTVFGVVFSPETFRLVGLGVIVLAARARDLRATLFAVAAIWLSGPLDEGAKALAGRPRPPGALASGVSSSFPSGHALEVLAAVLALLSLSTGLFSRGVRMTTVVAGALIVVVVGVDRVVLNVHYPSDVLAGWALGYVWFFLCWLVFRPEPPGALPNEPQEQRGRNGGRHQQLGGATDGRPQAPDAVR